MTHEKRRKKGNTVLSISAFIDLLGFSSHLELSSFDLRTEVGQVAFSRLQIIEDAIKLFEEEIEKHPEIYPENLRYKRFNDALILCIDVKDIIIPKIGQPNVPSGFTYNEVKDLAKTDDTEGIMEAYNTHFGGEAINVGLFIGLVSRIHMFINQKEQEINMPGCRTTISSGLRFQFYDRMGNEDFDSANFSFTNAYIVNEAGTKKGFSGNELYLDDNVAKICGFNDYAKRLIAYSKFRSLAPNDDPYQGITKLMLFQKSRYELSTQISIRLFGKDYSFRALNTSPLTNFQILPAIIDLSKKYKKEDDSFTKKIIDGITNDPPDLKEVNETEHASFSFIFLHLNNLLSENYGKTIKLFENN